MRVGTRVGFISQAMGLNTLEYKGGIRFFIKGRGKRIQWEGSVGIPKALNVKGKEI